jgi:hypothetical protein
LEPCIFQRLSRSLPPSLEINATKSLSGLQAEAKRRHGEGNCNKAMWANGFFPIVNVGELHLVKATDAKFGRSHARDSIMFSLPALDVNCNEDDWVSPVPGHKLCGVSSVNSWAVISIGRGFNWPKQNDTVDGDNSNSRQSTIDSVNPDIDHTYTSNRGTTETPIPVFVSTTPVPKVPGPKQPPSRSHTLFVETLTHSPSQSPAISPHSTSFLSRVHSFPSPSARSLSAPRPRRRSSKQWVELIAGHVSICPTQPPSPTLLPIPSLHRADSSSSFLSVATSTSPPSPRSERESFLGRRSISEFDIEREIGKGAYGTVKRAREMKADGSLGVRSLLSPSFPALLRCGSRRLSSRKSSSPEF